MKCSLELKKRSDLLNVECEMRLNEKLLYKASVFKDFKRHRHKQGWVPCAGADLRKEKREMQKHIHLGGYWQ